MAAEIGQQNATDPNHVKVCELELSHHFRDDIRDLSLQILTQLNIQYLGTGEKSKLMEGHARVEAVMEFLVDFSFPGNELLLGENSKAAVDVGLNGDDGEFIDFGGQMESNAASELELVGGDFGLVEEIDQDRDGNFKSLRAEVESFLAKLFHPLS